MLTPQEMEENIKTFKTNLKNLQIKNNLEKLESNIGNQMLSGPSPDLKTIENLKKQAQGDRTFERSPVPPYKKIEEKTYFTTIGNSIKNVFKSRERNQLNVLEANYVCQKMCDRSMYDTYTYGNDLPKDKSVFQVSRPSNFYGVSTYSFKNFGFHELKAINKQFFGYYESAGKLRDQDLKKDGISFIPKYLIETVGQKIFSDAKEDILIIPFADTRYSFSKPIMKNHVKLDTRHFSEKAGEYLGQLTRLQAFQEGNGRTNRAFISEMADLNGLSISWQNISQKEMKETSIMACKGDSSGLVDLLQSNILERDLEKMTDLMKGISDELTVKRVNLAKETEYQGIIFAEGDHAYLQQQKDNPHEIIFHERESFERHPTDIIDGDAEYDDLLGNEWLVDYKRSEIYFEGERTYRTHGRESPEQDNMKTSKHRDDYEEDYER